MADGVKPSVLSRFSLFTPAPNREQIELTGERLLLRPLSAGDADDMFQVVNDPEVTHFLPWYPATEIATVRHFLQEQVARRRRGDSLGFALVIKETDKMVGSTDLMDLKVIKGEAELGYLLARQHWGQGVMTEAALLTVEYGFRHLNLGRVKAWADQENTGSRRVMEKLGMHIAGTEFRYVKDERRPYVRYEILRSVWEMNH